jgi:serine/threonine protein kinase
MEQRKPQGNPEASREANTAAAKDQLTNDSGSHSVALADSADQDVAVQSQAQVRGISPDQPRAGVDDAEKPDLSSSPPPPPPANDGRPRELQVGQMVSERYRVLDLVGSGGMGSVYRVEQVFLHKQLALKTLNPSTHNELSWPRFQKEARAASLFDHPNLIKVHDFGLIGSTQPFFVMDFFDGETLSKRLRRDGPLSLEMALTIFIQACDGLAHAHKQGVVHRDIKPGNIMLSWAGDSETQKVKIVDFGIAKVVNAESDQALALTRTGEVFGTPFYMSPEQCLGRELDHRADIYSLGCVMFEALSGTPPFLGDTALAIMMKHQSERPPTFKEATLGKEFPPDIETIVTRMIEKNPNDRYQNLFDVARDLYRVKRGEPIGGGAPSRQTTSTINKSNSFSAAALAVVVAIFAALIFFAGRFSAPPELAPHTVSDSDPATTPHVEEKDPEVTLPKTMEFYSTWTPENPQTRYFHFPAKSLGAIYDVNPKTQVFTDDSSMHRVKSHINAQNTLIMEHFQPFGLQVSHLFIEQPDFLLRFRSDELCELSFSQFECSLYMDDSYMEYVKKLKSLRSINLFNCRSISDKGLLCLNSLPNLVEINAGDVRHLSGEGLSHITNLKKLQSLHVERLKRPEVALKVIQGSATYKELEMRQSDVDDRDCQLIASLSNLETLDLCNNHVNDAGLKALTKLRKLTALNLHKDPITPASIETFKQMTQLRRLAIETSTWSDKDRARLQQTLKSCSIFDTPRDDIDTEIDGYKVH